MRRQRIGKAESATIISEYKGGSSLCEIGRKTGRHHGVISYHLVKHGIRIRPQSIGQQKTKTTTEDMARLYRLGMSLTEVGDYSGVCAQAVADRFKQAGIPTRSRSEAIKLSFKNGRSKKVFGKDHPCWKGGHINKNGYKIICVNNRQVLEHRYLWEQINGPLPKSWIIHHMNGNRLDNCLENLAAMPRKQHSPTKIIEPFKKRIIELENQLKQAGR